MGIPKSVWPGRPLVQKAASPIGDVRVAQGGSYAVNSSAIGPIATHALALADQTIVSGTSFLAMVLVGRWSNVDELGAYALGISLLVSVVYIQDSLISLPYTVQRPQSLDFSAEHAGSCLTLSAMLSVLVVIGLAGAALIATASDAATGLVTMLWTLAATAPFALWREFARGFAFAQLHVIHALVLDVVVAAIQLSTLFWLDRTGQMSAATACAAIGGACALTSFGWFFLARHQFTFQLDQVRNVARQSWRLGKWLFAVQITASVQRYAVYWLLPFVIGINATGVFAACMSVALLANPFILALANIRTARAIEALRGGGGPKLRRLTIQDALLLGVALTGFCLAISFIGDDVMRLLYTHEQFGKHGMVLTVVTVALLATAVGAPASTALTTMERPHAIFWSGLIGVVLTIIFVFILASEQGLVGAAYGFLIGSLAATITRWVPFLSIVAKIPAGPMRSRRGYGLMQVDRRHPCKEDR